MSWCGFIVSDFYPEDSYYIEGVIRWGFQNFNASFTIKVASPILTHHLPVGRPPVSRPIMDQKQNYIHTLVRFGLNQKSP